MSKRSFISLLLLIVFFTGCNSQKKMQPLYCKGDILDVGIAVKGFSPCSHCEIKKDSLINGFSIDLVNPAYKLIGFRIGYYSNDQLLTEKEVAGNKITKKNAGFLNKLKPGDIISIECINIEKDKKISLSTTMQILVE